MKKVLVTGTAGFIGFHLAKRLLKEGYEVWGLDSINDYYDPYLKYARLAQLGINRESIAYGEGVVSETNARFHFIKLQLEEAAIIKKLMFDERFEAVVNLAAQAGVRYSIDYPHAYTSSNVTGFLNILEGCRHSGVKHLLYASTSSVYGLNERFPLSEHQGTSHPMSLYAATKKANEMMAHSYSHLFQLPTTGLRFFTVYGPWGRPDMALFLFTKAILAGEPVKLFNEGRMVRDFTYVEDIVESIARLVPLPPAKNNSWDGMDPDPATSSDPYRILNIGNSHPVPLMDYVDALEKALGQKAKKELLPMQMGDVPATQADCSLLESITGYRPRVKVQEGVREFVQWYRAYFKTGVV